VVVGTLVVAVVEWGVVFGVGLTDNFHTQAVLIWKL
jgi:hypothetical protein